MNASSETYNAVEYLGTYLPEAEIEQLAQAVERTKDDPMAFIEVGRIYCDLIAKEIIRERKRSADFWRDAFALTEKGDAKVRTL